LREKEKGENTSRPLKTTPEKRGLVAGVGASSDGRCVVDSKGKPAKGVSHSDWA